MIQWTVCTHVDQLVCIAEWLLLVQAPLAEDLSGRHWTVENYQCVYMGTSRICVYIHWAIRIYVPENPCKSTRKAMRTGSIPLFYFSCADVGPACQSSTIVHLLHCDIGRYCCKAVHRD